MEPVASKACRVCGEVKPASEFYRHKSTRDRLFAECKFCWCARTRKYRADNDEVRVRDRNRNTLRRSYRAAAAQKYAKNSPEKVAAHVMVSRAISKGDLLRQPCQVCGATEFVHAHHEDYSKPLDVIWLCARHHTLTHSRREWKWVMKDDGQWHQVEMVLTKTDEGFVERPATEIDGQHPYAIGASTDELRVRKYVHHITDPVSGLQGSYNSWEVRKGVKLVKRFDRRCDAYAFVRAARSQDTKQTERAPVREVRTA